MLSSLLYVPVQYILVGSLEMVRRVGLKLRGTSTRYYPHVILCSHRKENTIMAGRSTLMSGHNI